MPKETINYSNTIIYQFSCKDVNVSEIYIGHTTNYSKRKYHHKMLYNKGKTSDLYDLIRNNGGWNNWNMSIVAKYNCCNAKEAKMREKEHYNLLMPPINNDNDNNKNTQSLTPFICDTCKFKCATLLDWNKHVSSKNHTQLTISSEYMCHCGKKYKHMSSLCNHKKKCDYEIDGINIQDKDALVIHLLKQNSELQNKIVELSFNKSITNNTNCNNTTNNAFNLHFFLNETCKDAMNISEFVSSIKLSIDDLEHTGRCGYIEGITNIIVKNLSQLEHCFRPVHCSDYKREIIYIKDNDKWEKECETKPILTNAIKTIANENIKQINIWRDHYPDCIDSESDKNNLYLKIVSNSMNGMTKEEGKTNVNKIISNVAKETLIPKNQY